MNYNEIKTVLSNAEFDSKEAFNLLKGIARHVNNRNESTYEQGRDLVIRALSRVDRFDKTGKQILGSLVRAVGLYPYLSGLLEHVGIDDQIAYDTSGQMF